MPMLPLDAESAITASSLHASRDFCPASFPCWLILLVTPDEAADDY